MPMLNLVQDKNVIDQTIEEKFRKLLDEFCTSAAFEGVQIVPYTETSWRQFASLSPDKQKEKYDNFERYYETCMSFVNSGGSLRNGIGILKSLIHRLGLRASEDIFDRLSEDDVIEVYTCDFTQIFRNLKFLEICSYPLLDLYVYEWFELYRRPHTITQHLIEGAKQVLMIKPPKTIQVLGVPDHFSEEIFSPRRHKFYVQQKLGCPLADETGENVAFIGSLHATLLDYTDEKGMSKLNVTPLSV